MAMRTWVRSRWMEKGEGSHQERRSVHLHTPFSINPWNTPRLWFCDTLLSRERQNSPELESRCEPCTLILNKLTVEYLIRVSNLMCIQMTQPFGQNADSVHRSGARLRFAFLTRSQVMSMLSAPRPYFE